ncbi:MAG: sulfatase-like hydrolase/transferase [Bacteroidota bacterium]
MRYLWPIFLSFCFLLGCKEQSVRTDVASLPQIRNPHLDFTPNILWIVAEDMSPYIPAFGDSTISTPHLNQLAKEGVCYDNFFSPHPVCSPGRAATITGMYANSIGASHMRTGPWMLEELPEDVIKNYKSLPAENIPYEAVPPPQVRMFPEYLRANGYYCTNNSKEDYQFIKTMTAWDESSAQAHWRNRPKNTPFFSVFNIGVTHESQIWAKAKDSLWVDENLEVPIPPYLPDTEVGKTDIRRMYSNILEMDAKVGGILAELKADGLLDRTIVVWFTDHGGPLPRQKRVLYDSGTKVPMIIRFPNGQFAGERDDRMISFIDLAPTMLSLFDIPPPDHIQGAAFLGKYLRTEEPDYVFGAADRFDEFSDNIRSVRDTRFKYIKNYHPQKPLYADVAYRKNMPVMQELLQLREDGELSPEQALWFQQPKPEEELYDITNDPHEVRNLAKEKAYENDLLRLRNACSNWVNTINDTGLGPEQELIERFWPNGIQPVTAQPILEVTPIGVAIECATQGASIGYRIVGSSSESWQVYEQPLSVKAGTQIEAIAHRLGYERSAITTYVAE